MTPLNQLNGTFVLDPTHSRLGFVARHAMVTKVRGNFDAYEGTATVDAANPASSTLRVEIQAASINTGNADRDAHLMSADFFDVEKYPDLTFTGSQFEIVDDETVRVIGDLTIKDVTKPVTVDFTYGGTAKDPYGNERVGFEGATTLNRSDFGLTFNAALETGGVLISDKITLELEVSAIRQV